MIFIKKIGTLLLLVAVVVSCKSSLENPRLEEQKFATGGYMRIVTPYPFGNGTAMVSLANLTGTKLEVLHEAVTPDKGSQFSSYDLVIRFVDKTAANGTNNVADKTLRSIAASTFTKDPQTNYPRATMTVTGQEALTAIGLTPDEMAVGDYFEVRGTMKLSDGRTFSETNTGSNILGGAFYSSPFLYRINVVK